MNYLVRLFFPLCIIVYIGCKKKDLVTTTTTTTPPPSQKPVLKLSDTLINTRPDSGKKTITITSNTDWKIDNNSNWLLCDQSAGKGNATFNISWRANIDSARVDSIIVSAGTIRLRVVVTQSSQFIFLGSSFGLGNFEKTEGRD